MRFQSKRVAALKKRGILKTLMLATILFSAVWLFSLQTGQASMTIVVPQDYPTIGEAVSHASAGDVIAVKSGVYYENLQIDKSITLLGEDRENTLIIGEGGSDEPAILTLNASNIKVSGFTIQSVNSTNPSQNAIGVNLLGDSCTINHNIIKSNYFGIFCAVQSSSTVTNNIITLSIKDGVRFYSGSLNNISDNSIISNAVSGVALGGYSNTVRGNIFQGNTRGLGLGSSNSVVFNNTMVSNSESGLYLSGSKNVVVGNEIDFNKYGVYITVQGASPTANEIYRNNFVNNFHNAFGNSSYLVESWDGGSQTGGNYWGDYQTKYHTAAENGNSGIENTSYTINANNIDHYPLTAPFNISSIVNVPVAISPNPAKPNSVVALWSFDSVDSDLVAPDSTGNNPAVLGSVTGVYNYTPARVQGKFGEALSFNGNTYAAVQPSPSLEAPNDVTVDVWVNVPEIKTGVAYNNILIEAVRSTAPLPTRILGVAINGETPSNASSPPIGILRAYVMTPSGFNEINSKEPLPLNTWVHVVFVRSTTTGMHLYVDEKEQAVTIVAGTAKPTGPIQKPTDIYIGHDSITEIDQLQISNTAEAFGQPLWQQWWLWTAVILVGVAGSGAVFYFKKQTEEKLAKRNNRPIEAWR
jgi:parallel beta-helix repeat protein